MFGHWFADRALMEEMENSLKLYENAAKENSLTFPTEVAVFLDEEGYSRIGSSYPLPLSPNSVRDMLAKCGIPYNVYLIDDFKSLAENGFGFKCALFPLPVKGQKAQEAVDFCKANNIECLFAGEDKTTYGEQDVERLLDRSGVWRYTREKDVFYIGNGFFALHAASDGIKTVTFPQKVKITPVYDENQTEICSQFSIKMQKFETLIYKIEKA
jgi:sulfur relay (sulfurtransferase) DsrF/TusC family protein